MTTRTEEVRLAVMARLAARAAAYPTELPAPRFEPRESERPVPVAAVSGEPAQADLVVNRDGVETVDRFYGRADGVVYGLALRLSVVLAAYAATAEARAAVIDRLAAHVAAALPDLDRLGDTVDAVTRSGAAPVRLDVQPDALPGEAIAIDVRVLYRSDEPY